MRVIKLGVWILEFPIWFAPASKTRTVMLISSASLFATTRPPAPPPTTRNSYEVELAEKTLR